MGAIAYPPWEKNVLYSEIHDISSIWNKVSTMYVILNLISLKTIMIIAFCAYQYVKIHITYI